MSLRSVLSLITSLLSALVLGLAAGALWMVPTLYSGLDLPWLALPIGWLLGKAVRHWIRPAGWQAAVLAALATLVAAMYVNVLVAGARIASLMGLGLIDSLRTSGPRLLLQLAEMGCTPSDEVWYLAGMGVAAFMAARSRQARAPAP